jgi:hypothetical protein
VREIAELHRAAASLRPHSFADQGERVPGSIARVVFPAHHPLASGPGVLKPVQTGFA